MNLLINIIWIAVLISASLSQTPPAGLSSQIARYLQLSQTASTPPLLLETGSRIIIITRHSDFQVVIFVSRTRYHRTHRTATNRASYVWTPRRNPQRTVCLDSCTVALHSVIIYYFFYVLAFFLLSFSFIFFHE